MLTEDEKREVQTAEIVDAVLGVIDVSLSPEQEEEAMRAVRAAITHHLAGESRCDRCREWAQLVEKTVDLDPGDPERGPAPDIVTYIVCPRCAARPWNDEEEEE
jgi:hypothetical protein